MKNLLTYYYAMRDARAPWYARVTAFLSLLYLISPIDFVPDIVPLAGYIDDIVIVPFLLTMSSKLLPATVRADAAQTARRNKRKLIGIIILGIIVLVGIMILLFYAGKALFDAVSRG